MAPTYNISDGHYALAQLYRTRDDLAIGAGDVHSRLLNVFLSHLHVLKPSDFPGKLSKDWIWIYKKLTRKGPRTNPSGEIWMGSVEHTLRFSKNSTGVQIAKKLITLCESPEESRYLAIEDTKRLLGAVRGLDIETAVRIQLYCGLRVGEVQALQWSHLDFNQGKYGKLRVAGTYVRKESRFKDSPKGGEQHSIDLPLELREYLLSERQQSDSLFAHSSSSVTDRYIHDRGSQLEKVANVIRLFPVEDVSQKFPKSEEAVI
jgi:hypothetical protein